MKIQLQSLRVINCGPLRDVCIHFATDGDSPVTVLAGANGSGKTTALELIKALAELLDPDVPLAPPTGVLTRTEYAQMNWLVDGEKFSIFYGQPPMDAGLSENHFGRPGIAGQPLEITEGKIAPIMRERIVHMKATVMDFPHDAVNIVDKFVAFPSLHYFPHGRFIAPVFPDKVNREVIKCDWVYSYEAIRTPEGSLDSYLIWLEYAELETYNRVIEFLNSLDIDGKTFSVRRKDLKVLVTTRGGGTHFLEQLSSGEQNMLIMLLELRCRLRPYSIVLVDEIENSLHQALQKKLAQALKRMQARTPFQLIVTTHSIPIVETFGPASVRILTEF